MICPVCNSDVGVQMGLADVYECPECHEVAHKIRWLRRNPASYMNERVSDVERSIERFLKSVDMLDTVDDAERMKIIERVTDAITKLQTGLALCLRRL